MDIADLFADFLRRRQRHYDELGLCGRAQDQAKIPVRDRRCFDVLHLAVHDVFLDAMPERGGGSGTTLPASGAYIRGVDASIGRAWATVPSRSATVTSG